MSYSSFGVAEGGSVASCVPAAAGARAGGGNWDGGIGAAFAKMPYPMLKKFRLYPHEPSASCWLHDDRGCWSLDER